MLAGRGRSWASCAQTGPAPTQQALGARSGWELLVPGTQDMWRQEQTGIRAHGGAFNPARELRKAPALCEHPERSQRPRTCVVPVPIRAITTSWLFVWSVTLIPCRTWMCFSRMSRLLKVRLPSVQYLQGPEQGGSEVML